MTRQHFAQAASLLQGCEAVVDAGTPIGRLNQMNGRLLALAKEQNIPVRKGWCM